MREYKVLTINPGSTSTKIALFQGEKCLFSKNVSHDAAELAKFRTIPDQLPYRRDTILALLGEAGISLEDVDVFVGRGGGLLAMEGGTYEVTDLLLEHARTCANGVIHPAALGSQLAHEFATRYGARAMVVNPPDVDETQDVARMTGIKGVNRIMHLHALNLKETAIRHCKNVLGRKYEECNLVVCHIGGGMVHNEDLVRQITESCSFIAPVTAYPGEFEMEAMAAGAIRVLNGEEQAKTYTGKVIWDKFDWE